VPAGEVLAADERQSVGLEDATDLADEEIDVNEVLDHLVGVDDVE
jgi:hypothetical protein